MTVKEELLQYRFKVKKADQALEEYQKFKVRAEKVNAILSDSPSRSNKISDKVRSQRYTYGRLRTSV